MNQKVKIGTINTGTNRPPVLQEKVATPSGEIQEIMPDTGYDGLSRVTVEAVQPVEAAAPLVSIDNQTGIVSASVLQEPGFIEQERLTTASLQLPTHRQGNAEIGKTIAYTPPTNTNTSALVASAGTYLLTGIAIARKC